MIWTYLKFQSTSQKNMIMVEEKSYFHQACLRIIYLQIIQN